MKEFSLDISIDDIPIESNIFNDDVVSKVSVLSSFVILLPF